jgi:hypothetical protein
VGLGLGEDVAEGHTGYEARGVPLLLLVDPERMQLLKSVGLELWVMSDVVASKGF